MPTKLPIEELFDALRAGAGEAEVWCDFCEGSPVQIRFNVEHEREVTSILLSRGWSILRGKEMCPACSRRTWSLLKSETL